MAKVAVITGSNGKIGQAPRVRLAHAARLEFQYRFQWQKGSLAFWDNRATWHMAPNDYHGHRRLMHRISVEGCTEVPPISWTPEHLCSRSPPWPESTHRSRLSSVDR